MRGAAPERAADHWAASCLDETWNPGRACQQSSLQPLSQSRRGLKEPTRHRVGRAGDHPDALTALTSQGVQVEDEQLEEDEGSEDEQVPPLIWGWAAELDLQRLEQPLPAAAAYRPARQRWRC